MQAMDDPSSASDSLLLSQFSEPALDLSLNWLSITFLGIFAFGLVKVIYALLQLASFLHLHFLHRSALPRYRRPGAWALVTGASQGIGEAFVRGLASHGFNVVQHGRNEAKLQNLIANLEDEYPRSRFRYVIADAATSHGMEAAIQRVAEEMGELGGPLTVLVNNVGAMHGVYGKRSPFIPVQAVERDDVDFIINSNLRFTTQITRALLPTLAGGVDLKQAKVKAEPFLILNIASLAGMFGTPFLSIYSGTKAYINTWSRSVAQELAMQPALSRGECLSFIVGEVTDAGGNEKKASWGTPSTGTFVRHALARVGCGRLSLMPHTGHAVLGSLSVDLLPEWCFKVVYRFVIAEQVRFWKTREEREGAAAKKE